MGCEKAANLRHAAPETEFNNTGDNEDLRKGLVKVRH